MRLQLAECCTWYLECCHINITTTHICVLVKKVTEETSYAGVARVDNGGHIAIKDLDK